MILSVCEVAIIANHVVASAFQEIDRCHFFYLYGVVCIYKKAYVIYIYYTILCDRQSSINVDLLSYF